MQDDAIAVTSMDMGTPRIPRDFRRALSEELSDEVQRHHECFARRRISWYQRKVRLGLSLFLGQS